jgi:hypothetical protein
MVTNSKLNLKPGDLLSVPQLRVLNVNRNGGKIYDLYAHETPAFEQTGYTHWGDKQRIILLIEKTIYNYNDFFRETSTNYFKFKHEIWKVVSEERTYWAMLFVSDHEGMIKLNEKQ